jgi:hypothetical protein
VRGFRFERMQFATGWFFFVVAAFSAEADDRSPIATRAQSADARC